MHTITQLKFTACHILQFSLFGNFSVSKHQLFYPGINVENLMNKNFDHHVTYIMSIFNVFISMLKCSLDLFIALFTYCLRPHGGTYAFVQVDLLFTVFTKLLLF